MKTTSQIAEALKDFKTSTSGKLPGKATAPKLGDRALPDRRPYAFNLGLDFGTAFTKCILRDIRKNRASLVMFDLAGAPTFLVSSEVYLDGGTVRTPFDDAAQNAISVGCLKMALYATVRDFRGDPWLLDIARHWPADDEVALHRKIEALVIFYLAAVIRYCRTVLRDQRPDFGEHKDDVFSVNMAVPVAHTQKGEGAFTQCLNRAWRMAHDSAGGPMLLEDLLAVISKLRRAADDHLCAIYPEVSANVQAFIQSRSGFAGLFMFVDVGAGTVDASTFIYWPSGQDGRTLSYLSAEVIPLGSSQIEMRAAHSQIARLQRAFRNFKEGTKHEANLAIVTAVEVRGASATLSRELLAELARCAGLAHEKLTHARRHGRMKQWHTLRILMGGGGSVLPMYCKVARDSFKTWLMAPETALFPLPLDLDWPPEIRERDAIFRRMTVAYGLSFDFPALDQHRFPEELEAVSGGDESPPERYHAPSKDEI